MTCMFLLKEMAHTENRPFVFKSLYFLIRCAAGYTTVGQKLALIYRKKYDIYCVCVCVCEINYWESLIGDVIDLYKLFSHILLSTQIREE